MTKGDKVPIYFEGDITGKYAYTVIDHRPPRKGEFYLSGAVLQAWRAPNDLSHAYTVVTKEERYVLRQVWVRATAR